MIDFPPLRTVTVPRSTLPRALVGTTNAHLPAPRTTLPFATTRFSAASTRQETAPEVIARPVSERVTGRSIANGLPARGLPGVVTKRFALSLSAGLFTSEYRQNVKSSGATSTATTLWIAVLTSAEAGGVVELAHVEIERDDVPCVVVAGARGQVVGHELLAVPALEPNFAGGERELEVRSGLPCSRIVVRVDRDHDRGLFR